jgi:hypothetical protein
MRLYLAAKNAAKTRPIQNLHGGDFINISQIGTLMNENDKRTDEFSVISDVGEGTNMSFSFSPASLSCGKISTDPNTKKVWILTDQNFSPILPSNSNGKCPNIVRMENGALLPLANSVLSKYGSYMGKQDIILIGSATQSIREGLEGYVGSL